MYYPKGISLIIILSALVIVFQSAPPQALATTKPMTIINNTTCDFDIDVVTCAITTIVSDIITENGGSANGLIPCNDEVCWIRVNGVTYAAPVTGVPTLIAECGGWQISVSSFGNLLVYMIN